MQLIYHCLKNKHLTQYSSNEQLRIQQEKILTLRKVFDKFKEFKSLNKKKKEIQSKLFQYYESRYIRRPLRAWNENIKMLKAKKISITIIYNAILKINIGHAFNMVQKFSQAKKKHNTIKNLLKCYEKQTSLACSKTFLDGENISQKQQYQRFNSQSENNDFHKTRKDKNSLCELHNSDKENNLNIFNTKNSFLQEENNFNVSENQQTIKNPDNKKQIHKNISCEEELLLNKDSRYQINFNFQESISETYFKINPVLDKDVLAVQNNISNEPKDIIQNEKRQYPFEKNPPQNRILSKHDVIFGEQNIYSNRGENCIFNSSSQHQQIYNLINDKSSMVFDCSKTQYNNHIASSNSVHCDYSNQQQNKSRKYASSNSQQNKKCEQNISQIPQTKDFKQENIDSSLINIKTKLQKKSFDKDCYQKQNFSQNIDQASFFETSQFTNSEETNRTKKSCPFHPQKSNVWKKDQVQSQDYQSIETFSHRYLTEISSNRGFENNQKAINHQILNDLDHSDEYSQQNYEKIENDNMKIHSFKNNDRIKIKSHSGINSFANHYNISISSIPQKSSSPQQHLNNNQNHTRKTKISEQEQKINHFENDALNSFTQSQLKNLLYVASQNKNQIDDLQTENQIHSIQQNAQAREIGKIKRNSTSCHRQCSQNNCYHSEVDTSLTQQNISFIQAQQSQINNRIQHNNCQRGKNSYFTDKQDSIKNQNVNSEYYGLISYVNRNKSISRLSQQLEKQANEFNLRKIQVRDQSLTEKINTAACCSHQSQDSKNNFFNSSEMNDMKNNEQNHLNKQLIDTNEEKGTSRIRSSEQLQKPPLSIKFIKENTSFQTNKVNNNQMIVKNDFFISSNNQQENLQRLYHNENNRESDQSSIKFLNRKQDYQQTQNEKQKRQRAISTINQYKNQGISQQISQRLYPAYKQDNRQQYLKNSDQNSYVIQEDQNYANRNLSFEKDIRIDLTMRKHRSASVNNSFQQNYQNHIKNKEYSEGILEQAIIINQQNQIISKKQQEQINQLKQYQHFKSIKFQKESNLYKNEFNKRNDLNKSNSYSQNVSFEVKKKQELSSVGQSIQNALYLEAKIRSKRLERSQERTKNNSIELTKKLENLENQIQQMNNELNLEKKRRAYLLDEKQYLLCMKENDIIS